MLKKFADDLKYIRIKSGKELKEISEETKLHSGILEKIENADFTFQPQLYIRAFLKQFAKAIGISPDKVLKDYDLAKAGKYSSDVMPEIDEVKTAKVIEQEINVSKIISPETSLEEYPETSGKPEVNSDENRSDENKTKKEILDSVERSFSPPEIEKEIKGIDELKPEVKDDKKDDKKDEKKVEKKDEDEKPSISNSIKKEQPLVTSQKKRADEDIENKVMNFKPAEKTMIASVKNDPKFATGEKYMPAIRSRSIDSSVFKNILMGFVILLVAAGLIALFKVLFVDGSKDNPEIKRQNFDEVVKENEKKILGKRSDEEIRDSIAKANEDARKLEAVNIAKSDSITLDITALSSGWLFVITDSVNYKFPERVYFDKGDQEIWKAKNFFHLGTPNGDAIEVKLNGKKLTFDKKDFRYIKLGQTGIIK
ncbi:hypothetical protein BH10BAC5_BH10BAC5_10950 [soil metagenome]